VRRGSLEVGKGSDDEWFRSKECPKVETRVSSSLALSAEKEPGSPNGCRALLRKVAVPMEQPGR
jgi:hypothetical protein